MKYKHIIFEDENIPCKIGFARNQNELIVDFVKYKKCPYTGNNYVKEEEEETAKRIFDEYKRKILSLSIEPEMDRLKLEFLKQYIQNLEQFKFEIYKLMVNHPAIVL